MFIFLTALWQTIHFYLQHTLYSSTIICKINFPRDMTNTVGGAANDSSVVCCCCMCFGSFLFLLSPLGILGYTVKKEMTSTKESEILHEIVRNTTRKSEQHELIRVVSRNYSRIKQGIQFLSLSS